MITRRKFVTRAAAAAAGAAAACGLYAWRVEPHWLETVRRPMPLERLPASLRGRTLLHLSDLHVGPVDPEYLGDALRRAAALRPDIVALSGDFVSHDPGWTPDALAGVLEALPHGRLATVASLGNHDYGPGWRDLDVAARVTETLSAAGARVLRNATFDLHGLQLVGLGDLWSPEFDAGAGEALAALDPARPTVALCHNPDALDRPVWEGVRGWALAGHTHGGQCRPPFLPPPILPVRNRRYSAGQFDVGPGRTLYINRGLGHFLPVRFNVRPEITLFTLVDA